MRIVPKLAPVLEQRPAFAAGMVFVMIILTVMAAANAILATKKAAGSLTAMAFVPNVPPVGPKMRTAFAQNVRMAIMVTLVLWNVRAA